MIWQHFVMLQLALLALGLGTVMGLRSWQLKRQMAILTNSFTGATAGDDTPAVASKTAPVEDTADADTTRAAPASAPAENEEAAVEAAVEEPAKPGPDIEPTAAAAEPPPDQPLSKEPLPTAATSTDANFDDLDELLAQPDDSPEETSAAAPNPTKEPAAQEATEPAQPPSTAAAASPSESEDTSPETGLRALVTKFAAENRELMERIQNLEQENQALKDTAETTAAADEPSAEAAVAEGEPTA